jgi:hypothetical protein
MEEDDDMFRKYKEFLGLLAALMLAAIPGAAAGSAVPGSLNYVEGQVTVAGQPVASQSVGSVQVEPNQVLETGQGRAEMLLTPGVFLRIGDNSSVRLVSPNLGDTRVEVLRGQAIAEVTEIFKDSNLWVMMDGSSTRLAKQGLYDFNANSHLVRVFDGKATVEQGDQHVNLKKGREVALGGPLKARHFDTKATAAEDSLYAWSNLRSEYVAEASMQSARSIYVGGSPYWYGAGWYWNPYWDMYGFIPGDGIWYSPFGWPYYSPWVVYSAPGFWGGGYGRGYYGHHNVYGRDFAGRGFVGPRGHGHISGGSVATRGFGGARMGGGFSHGFAGGMHGGLGGGVHGGFGGGMRGGFGGGHR